MTYVSTATEDLLSEATAKRLIRDTAGQLVVGRMTGKRGNAYLRSKLQAFATVTRTTPVLLIADLDSGLCPASSRSDSTRGKFLPATLLFRAVLK